MTKDEALKLALEALESLYNDSELMVTHRQHKGMKNAITAIRKALAQPDVDRRSTESKETFDQQEPVGHGGRPMTLRECMEAEEPASKQEPVAWVERDGELVWNNREAAVGRNLYTTPPQPEQNQFNPDWDAMAVMVEEQQRMAKRIAELEAQQEPVAWLHTKIEGVAVPHRTADLDKHPDRWEALYKTPPPCPTCEALARTVMLDQTYHDAQRKPLTDEEIWKVVDQCKGGRIDFARAIEAAHGIKE